MRASNPKGAAVCAAVVLALACARNGGPNLTGAAGHDGGGGTFDASAAAGQPDAHDAASAGRDGGAGQRDASAAGQGGDGGADAASDSSGGSAGAGDASSVSVTLAESDEAFRNPMKGFRPTRYIGDPDFKDHEYASTFKQYIPYSALESSATDTVQKINDWSDANWGTLRARNLKVIPRVVIVYPGTGEYWGDLPHDGTPNQWATPALKARLVAFVAKLGRAWDGDPRIAAVEMGLWGKWGEHNISPDTVAGSDRIPADFQTALGDAFVAAFRTTKVMVRYPNTFGSYVRSFGFYWDSFALPDDDNAGGGMGILSRDVGAKQMISGEVAYDWGDQSKLGGSPNGTLSSATNTDYVISEITKLRTSSLGWIAEYTPDGGTISANAARMQKAFGYRYVINAAKFTASLPPGGTLEVELTVANKGCAPFYYGWPIEVSLLDASRKPVWRAQVPGGDISQVNGSALKGSFNLTGVPNGTYTLAATVLDSGSNAPSLRFANSNYYRGGHTPIGRVAVGGPVPTQDLQPFDSLQNDDSLSY